MNILMLTNTYLPHVGGVAHSVASFKTALEAMGQRVLVVAPMFNGAAEQEPGVVRVPALQHFNGSDFSVRLPIPGLLFAKIQRFKPEIVHAHHPFLLGDTALRIATARGLPLVFTQHTMYEQYTHYVPGDSAAMKRFAIRLATEFANLCDHVVAPSQSIAQLIRRRGVSTAISVIPTGVDPARFAQGDGQAARQAQGIASDDFVVGHVGRLAPEKNLAFLAEAVTTFMLQHPRARFLVVGGGPAQADIEAIFARYQLGDRLHFTGPLRGQALADAYHAMDVFAFASRSETQGMVLAEAITAGVPVVALDAPGSREVVQDGVNGRLLKHEEVNTFADALRSIAAMSPPQRRKLSQAARDSAEPFLLERCAKQLLDLYHALADTRPRLRHVEDNPWTQTLRILETEWNLWSSRAEAVVKSIRGRKNRRQRADGRRG
ncbi:MAG TPA: glycosyltransferase [Phycisphaeraceae bacterium]